MICTCFDSGVSINQEKVHEKIFFNAETYNKAVILNSIDNENNLILLLKHREGFGEENVNMFRNFLNGEIIDYHKDIKYMISLMQLFSALCRGRNFICKASVSNWFSLDLLINNIWNENLSHELRATLLDMLMSMHIDFQPRSYLPKPELIRTLENHSLDYMKNNFSNRHKILSIDSGFEIKLLPSKKTQSTTRNRRKSSILLDDFTIIPEKDEQALFNLKCELIVFFENLQNFEFNILVFQMLKLANMLIRFEVISTECCNITTQRCVYSFKSQDFSNDNMDIVRLLRSAVKILFIGPEQELVFKYSSKKNSSFSGLLVKNNINYQDQIRILKKSVDFSQDPFVKYIDGVQDYIEMQMTSSDVSNESDTIEVQCKLQLCDMLLQALNLRQDYLINNFIEWYKKENTFTTEKFSELFPPILKSGKQSAKNKFVTVFQPVFESITEIHPDLLGELLHSFMSANNYKLKTKLLEIILRLASQRKEFLKFLLKVKIMTGESDPEEFLSAKINISTLRNLVEQSEIICRYWGQSAGLFEKTSEKLDTLALLLINFEEIMHGNLDAKNEIKSGIDKDRQTMLKNLGFHTYVISLIRDGFHILEEIYEDCQKIHVKEARERLVGLFSLCFKTLRTFVYKNPRNQKALYANIGVICMNLRIQVHQIDLLCELFRDNSELCSYITEDFLQQFIDLIVSEGRQTVFLEFFEAITEINSVANLNIKRMILMLMCQPEVFYHVFYMETEGKFTFEISEQYVDQPYVYHAKLINILAKCGTSTARFQLTREKCQKIVPISEIFHLLTQDNIEFNALEYPLLNFFLKIYLSSDLEELENNENFLQTIEFKTDSLQKYLDRETNQLKEIEKWIEVIEVYTVKFMTGDYLKNTSFFILNYLAALGEKWEKIRELGISHKSVKRLKIISNLLNADFTKETEAEIEEMVFHKSMISEGQKKWAEILKVISDAKHKKFIKKEQVKSLKSIFHLQNQNSGATRSTIINSMIHYISFALDYTPPIDILCSLIRMLGLYLDNYHDETGKSNKKDIQEEYKKFGIVEIILSLMCSKQLDKRIFDVLIGFSNKLLEGGNENVQADFYEFFISMSTSENFFYRVHKMIAEYTQSLDSISDKNLKHISIYKRSTKAMSNITRLLQLFCENHNEVLQNYIRIQIRSRNSFDLVESVIILLQELMKRKKPESFHIIRHCFEMLIECIQGPCKQNQKAIINSKFLEVASNILSIDENSATNQNYYALNDLKENNEQTENEYMQGWMISHLKYKCLTMLMALLEGQTDNYIIIRMARAFNLLIFKENILSVFKMYLDMNKSEEYNEKLFNHFEQNQGYIFNSKKNPQDENSKYYTFVIENGFLVYYLLNLFYSIEDDEVQKMLFLDLPELCERKRQCSLKSGEKVGLAGQTQKMLMQNLKLLQNLIKSESQQGDSEILNKAFDFFEKNTGYIEVIFKGTLCSAYFWLPPVCHHLTIEVIDEFHSKVDRTSDKTKIESLLNYSNEVIEDMKYEEKLSMVYGYKLMTKWVRRFKILVFVLTILLNLVIILSYSDYGGDRLYGPSYLNVEITSNKSDRVTSTKALLLSVGLIHCILSGFIFLTFIIKTAPIIIQRLWRKQAKNSENSAKSSKCTHCLNNFKFFLLTCFYTLSNMDILYQLLYFTFAILGVAVHPFFFSAHLIDVFYRFPSLQSIVMAIVLPWRSLLLTLIFILVIVYFFSIWAYMQFNADFLDGCRSLLLCMKSVFDLGFKQSGGIGMWLDNIYEPPAGEIIYSRFFFDNLFTIILLWIMMNIIQGIIIVNFSVVRERQNSNFEDINNKCFICGKDRETIEKLTGNSFYQHRTYEHNEWNYVFFLAYLNFKQAIEYSGVESEIMQKITQKNIDWVPQQCMSFNKIKIEETDITESLISAQEQIKNLQQDLKHFKSKSLNDESRIF